MKNRLISLLIISLVLPLSFISTGFSLYSIDIINNDNKVMKTFLSTRNITRKLELAFEYTSNNANKDNPLIIKLDKATYDVKSTIHISSYTTLDLNQATLINANLGRGNILKSPEDKEYPKYSSLTDFSLMNGTLDDNYNINKSCILRLCHCENILIKNVSFLNNYFSHHCELAASRNVRFIGCSFIGQVSNLNISSSEAIQLDILDKIHFYGFTSYDNTMNDNILIDKCYFKNVYRGIGTHNYFNGLYQTNISITNCTFHNITDSAISSVNFKNIEYSNNNFINCKYSVFSRDNGK